MTEPLKLSGPVYCYLELTAACDSCCPGCSNVFVQANGHRPSRLTPPLDLLSWQQVLGKLRPYVHSLRLTGGEPTLHPEFIPIARCIGQMDLPFSVFTNGRWNRPRHLVASLSKISQLRSLLVSLHGANDADHSTFCGISGAFEETRGNIERAVEAGLTVNTSTVITNRNFDDVAEIARLSRNLGASYAVFNRLVGKAPCAPTRGQLRHAVHQIEQLRSEGHPVELSVCIPQCFETNSSEGCLAGLAFWTVDPWGNIRPCNHAPFLCGNLLEQEVAEIVDSSELSHWHNLIPSDCEHCAVYSRCHGGCRAQAMLMGSAQDNLMDGPLSGDPSPPTEIALPENAYPIGCFETRAESFGWILIHGGRVQPVSSDAAPLLKTLDGSLTLAEIQRQFGQEGLSFVASLLKKGFVSLKDG